VTIRRDGRCSRGAARIGLVLALAVAAACGDSADAPSPVVIPGGAGTGGAAGESGTSGAHAGSAGSTAGFPGQAGQAGKAGNGASAGTSGTSAGSSGASPAGGGGVSGTTSTAGAAGSQAIAGAAGSQAIAGAAGSGGDPLPCTTRITYGDRWIRPDGHPSSFDDAAGEITWDGNCTEDGDNAYAVLSSGWKPYFSGHGCTMALDESGCPGASPTCTTRIAYGPSWLSPADHPASYDDVSGRVTSEGVCQASGGESFVTLSNGWAPHFAGTSGCLLSLRYSQCGGLYQNPVVSEDCPDPGVIRDGDRYLMVCTGGDGGGLFVVRSSSDLVSWTKAGHVFPSGTGPAWGVSSFWAPEVHRVAGKYVAYFTARHQDGALSIGAAVSDVAEGPYADAGQPLVHESMGMIDASRFEDEVGNGYLVWKADGNAVGQPTPIYVQALAADGLSLAGDRVAVITNDLSWEGGVVEGPFVVRRDGTYFLFYSGNAYYNGTYAVGVARSASPFGPYEKHGAPILRSSADWIGPGHCSVVDAPDGDSYVVYHAWQAGHVNGSGDGRLTLVDRIVWDGGWPSVPEAPSSRSRPMP
jgi:arabinan endo-1,5-alpha-L-arabinosidase